MKPFIIVSNTRHSCLVGGCSYSVASAYLGVGAGHVCPVSSIVVVVDSPPRLIDSGWLASDPPPPDLWGAVSYNNAPYDVQ